MISIGMLTVTLVLTMAVPAWAHDCWLQPLGFQVLPYGLLAARLLVGDRMAPEKELGIDRSMTSRLDLHVGGNCIDLLPPLQEGILPAVECDLDGKEGQALLVMDRDFTTIPVNQESKWGSSMDSGDLHQPGWDKMKVTGEGDSPLLNLSVALLYF